MWLYSLSWALWVRFHGWYWYQSFIDGSNIWGVDRTDPWGPEMDHPPLGSSYLGRLMLKVILQHDLAALQQKLFVDIIFKQQNISLQRCSEKSWHFYYPYIYIYIYLYIYIYMRWSSLLEIVFHFPIPTSAHLISNCFGRYRSVNLRLSFEHLYSVNVAPAKKSFRSNTPSTFHSSVL